jgi:hypothetical protein
MIAGSFPIEISSYRFVWHPIDGNVETYVGKGLGLNENEPKIPYPSETLSIHEHITCGWFFSNFILNNYILWGTARENHVCFPSISIKSNHVQDNKFTVELLAATVCVIALSALRFSVKCDGRVSMIDMWLHLRE